MGIVNENHCTKRVEAEKDTIDNQPWLLKPESTI